MLLLTLITLLVGVLGVIVGWAATIARMDRTHHLDQLEAVDASV